MNEPDAYRAAQRGWSRFLEALGTADDLIASRAGDSDCEHAEGYRYLTRLLGAGAALCMEAADPDYPAFVRLVEPHTAWGVDNPDCLYLFASIRGDCAYRISGTLGTACLLDIQVQRGHFADAPDFGVISTANQLDLGLEPDRPFTLTLEPGGSSQQPLWLEADAGFVLVRQYFADWEQEHPAEVGIERVDAAYPPPHLGSAQVARRFDRYSRWMTSAGEHWANLAAGFMSLPTNSMVFIDPDASAAGGGFAGLRYGFGNFTCGDDEAVILEARPPDCRYWSFALADRWWQSFDYLNRQISLNGAQAQVDSDGRFRAVISNSDPGAANWLDASGRRTGAIAGRALLADESPEPTLRVVPLGELRSVLPTDTRYVSESERSSLIAARRRALTRRMRR